MNQFREHKLPYELRVQLNHCKRLPGSAIHSQCYCRYEDCMLSQSNPTMKKKREIAVSMLFFIAMEILGILLLTSLQRQCSFEHIPRPSLAPQLSGHACMLQSFAIQSPLHTH